MTALYTAQLEIVPYLRGGGGGAISSIVFKHRTS